MDIKNFYLYNKKLILGILIGFIILISLISIFRAPKNNNKPINDNSKLEYKIVLFGLNEISINKDDKYQEPGYYATLNGNIVTDQVVVTNLVDTSKVGTYVITYVIDSIKEERIVNVIDNSSEEIIDDKPDLKKEINLKLNGSSVINLNKGDKYQEFGCKAYFENKDISNYIKISGSVNTNISGTYYVTYKVSYENLTKSITRTVIVDQGLSININYQTNYVKSDLIVNISVTGSNFSYIKTPDGSKIENKNATYKVSQNGTYTFLAYDKNNNYVEKKVTITNIDKTAPKGTCVAKVANNKTVITVSATDNIGIEKYYYNNTYMSNNPTYTVNSNLPSVSVLIYDKAGNTTNITCKVESSKIEMHFIVGQSDDDAILIRTDNKTIMIDGGRYDEKNKVLSYLKKIGVTKIDAMIGSHVHWNHVQAQASFLDNFEVTNLYYPVDILNCVSLGHCESNDIKYIANKITKMNKTPKILKPGDFLQVGDMKLYFIGPTRGKLTTYQNANSFVFILVYGNLKYMFTGDTPSEYMDIPKFTNYANSLGINLDIDFFKWPHHGIETITDEFFKLTTPKYALIPNFHGCSNINTTKRNLMNKYNITYYELCDGVDVILTSDGSTINMKKVK